jgi:glucan phosphorylase
VQVQTHALYVSLLRWSGCTANAPEFADLMGDDVGGRQAMLAVGLPAHLVGSIKPAAQIHCEVSGDVARTLGMPLPIERALRLWQSEPIEELNFELFNAQQYALAVREKNQVEDITRVLYPNDSTEAGKKLRLKQQYLLVSASLQSILAKHIKKHGTLDNLADFVAIHINDTHPALVIPELMRFLLDECGYA